jgi:hypothetical protein
MEILKEIESHLPIKAYPTEHFIKELKKKNVWLKKNSPLEILKVHDAQDFGGILCEAKILNKNISEVVLISITFLTFDESCPIKDKIDKYILDRMNNLGGDISETSGQIDPNKIGKNIYDGKIHI